MPTHEHTAPVLRVASVATPAPPSTAAAAAAAAQAETEAEPRPSLEAMVDALIDFRARVANLARPHAGAGAAAAPLAVAVLQQCDRLRDDVLPPLHLKLQVRYLRFHGVIRQIR